MVSRLKNRLQREWNDHFYDLKGANFWGKFTGSRILIHHGVVETGATAFNSRFVTRGSLEAQIKFYKKHFHIASIRDYVAGDFPKDRFTVVFTFDDGYKNNLDFVLPLLEKYEVPACFFVTSIETDGFDILWADHLDLGYRYSPDRIEISGHVYKKSVREYVDENSGIPLKQHCKMNDFAFKQEMMEVVSNKFRKNSDLTSYWELMRFEDIKKLNESLFVTIGSHGHFHNNYAQIPTAEVVSDLAKSKRYLEDIVVGDNADLLAFPDGSYTSKVIDLAESAGFKYQFTTGHLFPDDDSDSRLMARFGINPYIKAKYQAKAMIDGKY